MNNVFDFKRFGNYFLYDLRRAKNNYAISLLVIGLLPVALFIITQFFSLITGNGVTELSDVPKIVAIFAGIAIVMLSAGARIYGSITEKRAGSDYLMLPASTLEKWLSMVLITCLVLPVILFALLFATDSLMGLVFPTAYGDRIFQIGLGQELTEMLNSEGIYFNFPAVIILNWCENILIFVLGAVCFKKAKVAKTLLCLAIVGMVFSTLLVAVLGTSSIDPDWFTEHFASPEKAINAFNLFLNIFYIVVLCGLLGGLYYRLRTLKH